jgi:hypothetical protein
MLTGTPDALKPKQRKPAFARLVAILCALTLLIGGFAHGVNEPNAPVTSLVVLVAPGADDASDVQKDIVVAPDHCVGCVVFAASSVVETTAPQRLAARLTMPTSDEVRPYQTALELPPPISAI